MSVKHKFHAIPTEVDDIRFASKAEARFYRKLMLLKQAGEVLFFHMQVPVLLPGKTKYLIDFQVFYADGTVEYIDVKGITTPLFALKKRQVEALYPFKIKVVHDA